MSVQDLSSADLELLRDARDGCKSNLSVSAAEGTVEDVLQKLGGTAPLAVKHAHEALQNGDREAAAEHLDGILK